MKMITVAHRGQVLLYRILHIRLPLALSDLGDPVLSPQMERKQLPLVRVRNLLLLERVSLGSLSRVPVLPLLRRRKELPLRSIQLALFLVTVRWMLLLQLLLLCLAYLIRHFLLVLLTRIRIVVGRDLIGKLPTLAPALEPL